MVRSRRLREDYAELLMTLQHLETLFDGQRRHVLSGVTDGLLTSH